MAPLIAQGLQSKWSMAHHPQTCCIMLQDSCYMLRVVTDASTLVLAFAILMLRRVCNCLPRWSHDVTIRFDWPALQPRTLGESRVRACPGLRHSSADLTGSRHCATVDGTHSQQSASHVAHDAVGRLPKHTIVPRSSIRLNMLDVHSVCYLQ